MHSKIECVYFTTNGIAFQYLFAKMLHFFAVFCGMLANVVCVLQVEQGVLKKVFHTLCCKLNKVVAKTCKTLPRGCVFVVFVAKKKALPNGKALC